MALPEQIELCSPRKEVAPSRSEWLAADQKYSLPLQRLEAIFLVLLDIIDLGQRSKPLPVLEKDFSPVISKKDRAALL